MIALVSLKALARQLPIISPWHLHICVHLSMKPRKLIMHCPTFLLFYVGYQAVKGKSDGIWENQELANLSIRYTKEEKFIKYAWQRRNQNGLSGLRKKDMTGILVSMEQKNGQFYILVFLID